MLSHCTSDFALKEFRDRQGLITNYGEAWNLDFAPIHSTACSNPVRNLQKYLPTLNCTDFQLGEKNIENLRNATFCGKRAMELCSSDDTQAIDILYQQHDNRNVHLGKRVTKSDRSY